jgi:protein TonB
MNRKIILCGLLGAAVYAILAQAPLKKVTRAEAMAAIVSKPPAEYPAIAKQLKMEGTVELEATVTEEGAVSQVAIISGNPVLTKAGVEAVKRWKFTPFKEDGKAIKVVAPVSLAFHVGGGQ